MIRFLVRRIGAGHRGALWLVTIVVFLLFFVGPGPDNVARTLAGGSPPQRSR